MLLPDNTGAKAADMISFLRLLRRHLGGALTICWDRGRIHDHSLAVRQWLAKQGRMRAERFPPYAPELNPDEYVWSYAKYAKLCNYAAPSMAELRERIGDELEHLKKNKTLLQGFIEHAKLNRGNKRSLCKSRNQ
jgi:transposase